MHVLTNGSFHGVQLCIHIHEALFHCCAVRGTGGCSITGALHKIMARKTVNKCRSGINAHLCRAICFGFFCSGPLTENVLEIISVVYSLLFFHCSPFSSEHEIKVEPVTARQNGTISEQGSVSFSLSNVSSGPEAMFLFCFVLGFFSEKRQRPFSFFHFHFECMEVGAVMHIGPCSHLWLQIL